MKRNKGITLVALIITIVIMLILVAVSVNVIIKSNLLGIAEKVTNKYNTVAQKESKTNSIEIDGKTYNSIDGYIETISKTNNSNSVGKKISEAFEIPHVSSENGNEYVNASVNKVEPDMFMPELQSDVEHLNNTTTDSTLKNAFGNLLESIDLYGKDGIKEQDINMEPYKFLSAILSLNIEEIATEDNPIKVTFVLNSLTDNMKADVLYYCEAHGWEILDGEIISLNQVVFYIHSGADGVPVALIYR